MHWNKHSTNRPGLFATHCRAADDSSAWPRGTAIIDRTTMHDSKCHKEAGIACTKSRKTKGTKASNFVAFCDFEDLQVSHILIAE